MIFRTATHNLNAGRAAKPASLAAVPAFLQNDRRSSSQPTGQLPSLDPRQKPDRLRLKMARDDGGAGK
jgi:hypothetical protein